MHESVQDSISDHGIRHGRVQVFNGQLAYCNDEIFWDLKT